jgi:hypothetical protein
MSRTGLVYFVLILQVLIAFPSKSIAASESSTQAPQAEVTPYVSCLEFPNLDCIESISATAPDGTVYLGKPTGTHVWEDFNAGPFWHAKGNVPVYQFPGLNFAFGTNQIVIRGFYWPDNLKYCAYQYCTNHNESALAWINPYAPGVNNPLFNTQVIFHLVLNLKPEFEATTSMGRAKNVQIHNLGNAQKVDGQQRSVIAADFTPIRLEQVDFLSSDPTASEKATSLEDGPALWIYGKNNDLTLKLGSCAQSGGIDVYSNAISMDMPTWNPVSRSIDVWTKSPHLNSNGDLNIGYLEARVPISMAKCMWGVNLRGEIQGKIGITYDDGSPNNVVTMTGNVNNGDYLLVVAGFHFSAPTFHIRLEDSMGSDFTPTIKQTPPAKSISCVKGKLIKKLSGTNPKCPAGYKAK